MKRKNILIAFFVVIFLVACGNNEETVSAETSSTEEVVSDEGEVVEAEADDAEIEETITEPERVQPDASITDWEDFYPFVSSLNLQEPVLLYYYDDEYKIIYNGDDYIVHDTVGDGYFLTNFELWTAKEIYEITTNVDVELNDNYYTQFSDDGIYYYGWGQCRFRALVPFEQDLIINIRYTDGTEEEFVAHLIPEETEATTEPEREQPDETITDGEESEGEEAPVDFSFTSVEEYLETVPVLSNTMPNTHLPSFIEYINSFDITETVIIFDDINGAKYMIYSGYPCAIGYYVPRFHVYSPEKEIIAGYVTGENGQELEGDFSCNDGRFDFDVMYYYDGDIYINVEYSDGATEELVVHFIDVHNS